ncbi:MAG: S8 family serine peptidase [Thermoplasmata archaeon]|nr:S8 family serine peptidase [Thermoplasmata archaeon]
MKDEIGIFVSLVVVWALIAAIPPSLKAETCVEKTKILIEKAPDIETIVGAADGKIIEEYEGFYLVEIPLGIVGELARSYTISQSSPDTIALNWAEFNIKNPPSLPPDLSLSDTTGYDYYIIQMKASVKQTWLSSLREKGCIVYDYLPHNAFVAKIPGEALDGVRSMEFVGGIVIYQPAYKLSYLLKELPKETTDIWIEVYPDVEWRTVVEKLLVSGAEDVMVHREGDGKLTALISAKVTPNLFRILLKWPEVYLVDRKLEQKIMNDVAGEIIMARPAWDANNTSLGVGLMGTNQVVGVLDTGLDTGNTGTLRGDFRLGPLGQRVVSLTAVSGVDADDEDGHGTHVAGSVMGNGYLSEEYYGGNVNDRNYLLGYAGIAPEAKLAFRACGTTSGGISGNMNYYNDLQYLYNQGARITSTSIGAAASGAYTTDSRNIDQLGWTYKDLTIHFANGNDGPGASTVGSPATAKNLLAVGASMNLRPEMGSDGMDPNAMVDFSSRGPCTDGRIKPDISAPGTWIISVVSAASTQGSGTSNENWGWGAVLDTNGDGKPEYEYMGGTSMATPITAGSSAIVRQYYTDVVGITPSSALIRATQINGAVDMGYKYPSNEQGWGRVNLKEAIYPTAPKSNIFFDSPYNFTSSGQTWNTTLNVSSANVPLKLTLTWTDYQGSTTASYALVNDLDLKIVTPDGKEYHGNYFVNGVSAETTTSWDRRNVVEEIYIPNPAAGTYTVQVIGYSVTQQPQPFALVASADFGPRDNYRIGMNYIGQSAYRLVPGSTSVVQFSVINYGTNADTVSLSTQSPPGITVSLSTSNLVMASGDNRTVTMQMTVLSSTGAGTYSVLVTGISAGNSSVKAKLNYTVDVLASGLPYPIQVTTNLSGQYQPAIAVNGSTVWIAYKSLDGGGNIYARNSSDGGTTWTEYIVSSTNGSCEEPSIAIESNGRPIVGWVNGLSVYTARFDGTKFVQTLMYTASSSGFVRTAKVVAQGTATWCFFEYYDGSQCDIYQRRSVNQGTWSTAAAVGGSTVTGNQFIEDAAVDTTGRLWLVYYQNDGGTNYRNIYYRTVPSGSTTWTAHTLVEGTQGAGDDRVAGAGIGPDGKIWIAWYTNRSTNSGIYQIYLGYFTAYGSAWSGTLGPFGGSTGYSRRPAITNDGTNVWVVYTESSNAYNKPNIRTFYSSNNFGSVTYKNITADAYNKGWTDGVAVGTTVYITYHSMSAYGNMDIFLAKVNTTATDTLPPITYALNLNRTYIPGSAQINLTGIADDSLTGYSNIADCEYFIDSIGASGAGTKLSAVDGSYNSPVESCYANINTSALSGGVHTVYVHAKDANGYWGDYASITFTVDTTAPTIIHTPVTSAPSGQAVQINATITDTYGIGYARLYYKKHTDATYLVMTMTKTTGNNYTATIPASVVVSPGVDYYIEASDLAGNLATHGNAAAPHFISVGSVLESGPVFVILFFVGCAVVVVGRRKAIL